MEVKTKSGNKQVELNGRPKVVFDAIMLGMEQMGADLIDIDQSYFYFEIRKGSEIDNKEKLIKAKEAFEKMFGLGMKIKAI